MTVTEAFNLSVAYYDDWIKQALPSYPQIFQISLFFWQ